MNDTLQVMACADDVNLKYDNIRTIKRIVDVLLNASKDIGLAVNAWKIRFLEVGHQRGMKASLHITVDSNSYEKLVTFKILSCLLTNQNYIHGEIKL
jgi:hypothetical protein